MLELPDRKVHILGDSPFEFWTKHFWLQSQMCLWNQADKKRVEREARRRGRRHGVWLVRWGQDCDQERMAVH